MNTIILKSEVGGLKSKLLELIKNSYLDGIPVVLPTETVYGLSAPYNNLEAIDNIFKIKNRPADNPLIVHIAHIEQIKLLSSEQIGPKTMSLLKSVWPGPLTLLLKKSEHVPSIVTANSEYVAIRMPNSTEFGQVIEFCGAPLVAPSANLSGKPSPTNANDAFEDLNGKVRYIIDGGQAQIGLESTIVRIEEELDSFTVLRPGKIDETVLAQYFANVQSNSSVSVKDSMLLCPGVKYKHYSPIARVWIIDDLDHLKVENTSDFIITCNSVDLGYANIYHFENEDELAKNLFRLFRLADRENVKNIFVQKPKNNLALLNRLQKAAEII